MLGIFKNSIEVRRMRLSVNFNAAKTPTQITFTPIRIDHLCLISGLSHAISSYGLRLQLEDARHARIGMYRHLLNGAARSIRRCLSAILQGEGEEDNAPQPVGSLKSRTADVWIASSRIIVSATPASRITAGQTPTIDCRLYHKDQNALICCQTRQTTEHDRLWTRLHRSHVGPRASATTARFSSVSHRHREPSPFCDCGG